MFIFTKAFWAYAGERAIKTVAQTALAGVVVTGVTGILEVAWGVVGSTAALAGIVSILTAIVAYNPSELPADIQNKFDAGDEFLNDIRGNE